MKNIQVSIPVFAAIWASRREGEETEDQILQRLLNVSPTHLLSQHASAVHQPVPDKSGVTIDEYGVHFNEGDEIFRTYKGKDYRARATGGRWLLLNDNVTYPSLHKLSWAVVGGRENAWTNWRIKMADGSEAFIDSLRPENKVRRRI